MPSFCTIAVISSSLAGAGTLDSVYTFAVDVNRGLNVPSPSYLHRGITSVLKVAAVPTVATALLAAGALDAAFSVAPKEKLQFRKPIASTINAGRAALALGLGTGAAAAGIATVGVAAATGLGLGATHAALNVAGSVLHGTDAASKYIANSGLCGVRRLGGSSVASVVTHVEDSAKEISTFIAKHQGNKDLPRAVTSVLKLTSVPTVPSILKAIALPTVATSLVSAGAWDAAGRVAPKNIDSFRKLLALGKARKFSDPAWQEAVARAVLASGLDAGRAALALGLGAGAAAGGVATAAIGGASAIGLGGAALGLGLTAGAAQLTGRAAQTLRK